MSNKSRNHIINTIWMISEQGLLMVSGIFVGVYIARYLGPIQYGIVGYSQSLIAFATIISKFGLESILIVKVHENKGSVYYYLGSAFLLMLTNSILSIAALYGVTYFFESNIQIMQYIFICSVSLFFVPFFVVDYFFQSQVKAHIPSICKTITLFMSSTIKIVLVYKKMPLVFFAYTYVFDSFVLALLLFISYYYKEKKNFMLRIRKNTVKSLASSAWPMLVSGISTVALTRTDQIMIKNMVGLEAVGLYSASTKIYDGWMTFLFVLSMALLPALMEHREKKEKYYKFLRVIFSCMFWCSVIFALFLTFVSGKLMIFLFGSSYDGSATVLSILVWSSVFVSMGYISTRYLIIEKLQKIVAKRNMYAVVINIPLNYFFIRAFEIEGAAIATLITVFFCHYLFDYTDRKLKTLVSLKNKGILFRWIVQ